MLGYARSMSARGANWERLVPLSFGTKVLRSIGLVGFPLGTFWILSFQASELLFAELPYPADLAIGFGVGAFAVVVVCTIHALLQRTPFVDLATQRLRVGRKVFGFAEITRATVLQTGMDPKEMAVSLRFGRTEGTQIQIDLCEGTKIVLDSAARDRVLLVLDGSNIDMPTSQYDPTGKFARYNFPDNVTKDAAIDLVKNPPGPDDPLPVVRVRPDLDPNWSVY